MRTMKRLSFNRTHRIQSKSSSPIALVGPNGAIILEPISIALAWSGFSARAFCAHCRMRTFATHAQSGYRSACLTSSFAFIPTVPPANPSTASPNGRRSPNHVPILQKMAEICGCERSYHSEKAPKMLRFCKTPGHDLPKAGTVHSLSCTTANLCQKVDNSD